MQCYSHLSEDERDQIGILRAAGRSMGAIARALDRAKTTISRELRRNGLPSGGYSPFHADGAYQLPQRGLALSPNSVEFLGLMANVQIFSGDPADALEAVTLLCGWTRTTQKSRCNFSPMRTPTHSSPSPIWATTPTRGPAIRKQSLRIGLELAQQAVGMDEEEPVGHSALGMAYMWSRELEFFLRVVRVSRMDAGNIEFCSRQIMTCHSPVSRKHIGFGLLVAQMLKPDHRHFCEAEQLRRL